MKRISLAVLLLSAACRQDRPRAAAPDAAAPAAVIAGENMIDFDGADGSYSCRAPAQWEALEQKSGAPDVMLFGTAAGPLRGKVTIAIDRYPDGVDRIKTPQDFYASMKLLRENPSPLEEKTINGRTVYLVHYDEPQHPPHGWKVLYMNRVDAALIPSATGFFAVEHSAPKDSYRQTLPIFDEVVASFKPKS